MKTLYRSLWFAAGLAALLLGMQLPARAQTVEMGRSGSWVIQKWQPGFCAALLTNPKLQLDFGNLVRIDLDGRKWSIVTDYRISQKMTTTILVDGDAFKATFEQIENSAVAPVKQDLIDAIKAGRRLNLNLDPTGPEYSLRGVSRAIEMVEACVQDDAGQPSDAADSKPAKSLIRWIKGRAGKPIDRRAVAVGAMADGMPSFVCVASYNGGLHPGMAGVWAEGCETGFAGTQVTVKDYSIMIGTGHWVRAAKGRLPANALEAGHEADGTPLFICRAQYQGGAFAGKTRPGFKGCNITDLGKEFAVPSYEVLTP